MRRHLPSFPVILIVGLVLYCTGILGGCNLGGCNLGGCGTAETSLGIVNLSISPVNPQTLPSQTVQFTGTANYFSSFKPPYDVTTSTWSSSNTAVATISQKTGLATAVAPGTTTISVDYRDGYGDHFKASTTLTVLPAPTISVSPSLAIMHPGGSQQLTATQHLSDGTTKDVTNLATWTTSDPTVAIVGPSRTTAPGQVGAVAIGMATITATFAGLSGSATISVVAPQPVTGKALDITPLIKVDGFGPYGTVSGLSGSPGTVAPSLVVFATADGTVLPNDTNASNDVFVACIPGATLALCPTSFDRASLNSSGGQIAGGSWHDPGPFADDASPMSGDGRFVLFVSQDPNVVSPATPASLTQIYLFDRCLDRTFCTPSTTLLSANAQGTAGNSGNSYAPAISANGRLVTFSSLSQNLISGIYRSQIYGRDTCFGMTTGCTPNIFLVSADNTDARARASHPRTIPRLATTGALWRLNPTPAISSIPLTAGRWDLSRFSNAILASALPLVAHPKPW
jgi:hypothetical protein